MRDILKHYIYEYLFNDGGHGLRNKSTSLVLVRFAHEFRFLSPCCFDVGGRNSSSNFTLMASSIVECHDIEWQVHSNNLLFLM